MLTSDSMQIRLLVLFATLFALAASLPTGAPLIDVGSGEALESAVTTSAHVTPTERPLVPMIITGPIVAVFAVFFLVCISACHKFGLCDDMRCYTA